MVPVGQAFATVPQSGVPPQDQWTLIAGALPVGLKSKLDVSVMYTGVPTPMVFAGVVSQLALPAQEVVLFAQVAGATCGVEPKSGFARTNESAVVVTSAEVPSSALQAIALITLPAAVLA
jgi:hypothetical protein